MDAAIDDYNTVISSSKNNYLAYYRRGLVYQQQGNDELAEKDFDKATSLK